MNVLQERTRFRKETIPPSSLRVQRPSYFATEGAGILGVLADFNFLHLFPEGGTLTGPVFAHNSDLGVFCHVNAT